MNVTVMLRKYVDRHAAVRGTLEGIKFFRRMERYQEQKGEDTAHVRKAISEIKAEYRKLRLEGFMLRRKLLVVMSAEEILHACHEFEAKCEEARRRHTGK